MTFEDAIKHVLKFEGGYVHDPKDPGGETKFGISKRAYPILEIASLTEGDAKRIYRRDYWDKLGIEKLPAAIRLLVFDSAVNQGPQTAIMMLQIIVGAKPDGILGPRTLNLVSTMRPTELAFRYFLARQTRYTNTDGFSRYGIGWLKRLKECTLESLKGAA